MRLFAQRRAKWAWFWRASCYLSASRGSHQVHFPTGDQYVVVWFRTADDVVLVSPVMITTALGYAAQVTVFPPSPPFRWHPEFVNEVPMVVDQRGRWPVTMAS